MSRKKKKIPRNKIIEVINFTRKTRRVINLGDEIVIFDEKNRYSSYFTCQKA